MNKATFVDVILPLAAPKPYTYAVPFDLVEQVRVGQRVIVQFGRRRMYAAIVWKIHQQAPQDYQAKLIDEIAESEPIVNAQQLRIWQWISEYYMCTLGEVMAAALPSAFKLSSESVFIYLENPDLDWEKLSDDEYLLAEALKANYELSLEDIQDILQKKSVYPVIEQLMFHRICLSKEEVKEKYKPKTLKYVKLSSRYQSDAALNELFESIGNAGKQTDVLLRYLSLSPQRKGIPKSDLLASPAASASSLKTLIAKEIFEEEERTVSRILSDKMETGDLENLSKAQEIAYQEIKKSFGQQMVSVLEGVTGSGKTHIYIRLIEEALANGKQVLYLLPEIALTAQIVIRLQHYFGEKIAVYHSKFNDQERVEIYKGVLNGKTPIVLSARSGVFLPYANLGLIIVDEEHERSYKQFEPAPRYHARDTAIILAQIHKAKVLLGSATLSFETSQNISLGKFGHTKLTERFGNAILPDIQLIDTLALKQKKQMQGLFSPMLKTAISEALERKEQVILFQNRRGFANYVNCNLCNWIPYCPSCDVSLTYHKFFNKLVCHYCGHQEKMVSACKACGSNDVQIRGFGTEQIEDDIQILFPDAKVARLDLDTTRKKHGHEEIIFDFQNAKIDILIGTQMVTKGLDFDHVSVVGIINADQLFSFPDFRAAERAFQLLAQVGGRAGRKDKPGKVLIQSNQIDHPVLQHIQAYNFEGFYFEELLTRKQYHYPPFVNLIQLTIKHKKPDELRLVSSFLADELRSKLGRQVLGPTTPLVSKVRNMYLRQVLIKVEKNAQAMVYTKAILQQVLSETQRQFRSAFIAVEVDA